MAVRTSVNGPVSAASKVLQYGLTDATRPVALGALERWRTDTASPGLSGARAAFSTEEKLAP